MSEGGFIIPTGGSWTGWYQVDTLEEAYQIMRTRRQHGKIIGYTKLKIEGEEKEKDSGAI